MSKGWVEILDGLKVFYDKDEFLLAHLSELTDAFKDELRKRFAIICHGENLASKMRGNYTYHKSVDEFLKRLKNKSDNVITGMLGELVVHVITGLVYPGYRTIVPYFNLEERNNKKGFDSIIFSHEIGMWTTEVKSSKNTKDTVSVHSCINDLLQTAHTDLISKLNNQDEVSRLWGQAMNGFQVACGNLKDEKETLENIILSYQEDDFEEASGPESHRVILSSVLSSNSNEMIPNEVMENKYSQHKGAYKELMLIGIHKSLCLELIEFFQQEIIIENS